MRSHLLDRLSEHRFDALVVGGGVNGAAAAAALAAAGASVVLVERGDFAGLTSQQSSNLVWGGIKYLQSYELRLVRFLCKSRNDLTGAFSTRIRATAFLGVIDKDAPLGRHVVGAGAGLYWILGGGRTAVPRVNGPRRASVLEPLIATPGLRGAVQYHDARLVNGDARFVWDFIATASANGAVAVNYVEVQDAERTPLGWRVGLLDRRGEDRIELVADVIVNAAGPLAAQLSEVLGVPTRHRLVLSKGVHLVVPRLMSEDRVVAMFDDDNRPFCVVPMYDRSMIGTTDTRVENPNVRVEAEDRDFLLAQVNRRLALSEPLTADDVIAERAGVRPLVVPENGRTDETDRLSLSRRHHVEVDLAHRVVSILGGKLTDCVNVGTRCVSTFLPSAFNSGMETSGTARTTASPEERSKGSPGKSCLTARAHVTQASSTHCGGARVRSRCRSSQRGSRIRPMREELFPGTQLTRAELRLMAKLELVVSLEDLLRRRTLLSQIRSAEELRTDPPTMELASMVDPGAAQAAVEERLA